MSEDPSLIPRRKTQISPKTRDRVEGLFEFSSTTPGELRNFLQDNGYESNLVVREGKMYAKIAGIEEYTPLNAICYQYADQALGVDDGQDYYIKRMNRRFDDVCRQAIRQGLSKGIDGASDAILEDADKRAEEARVETSLFSSLPMGDRRELLAYQMQIALLNRSYPEDDEQLHREIHTKLFQANNKIQELLMKALDLEQQEVMKQELEPGLSSLHRADEFEEKAKHLWQQFRFNTLEPAVVKRVAEVASDVRSFDARGQLKPEAAARVEENIVKDSSFGFMTFIHGCAALSAGLIVGALATIPGAIFGAAAGLVGAISSGAVFISVDLVIGAVVVGAAAGAIGGAVLAGSAVAQSVFNDLEKEYPKDKTMTLQYQQQRAAQKASQGTPQISESDERHDRQKPRTR